MKAVGLFLAMILTAVSAAEAQQIAPDRVPPNKAAPDTVTQRQEEAIGTIIYALISRRVCGYLVSQTLLQEVARQAEVTFGTEAEGRAADAKTIEIGDRFAGTRKALECARAYELYGPDGTAIKELFKRREE